MMIEAIGSNQVGSVAKNRPIKRVEAKKSRPDRKDPEEESGKRDKEDDRRGANIDERC